MIPKKSHGSVQTSCSTCFFMLQILLQFLSSVQRKNNNEKLEEDNNQ